MFMDGYKLDLNWISLECPVLSGNEGVYPSEFGCDFGILLTVKMKCTLQEYTDMIVAYGLAGENTYRAAAIYVEWFPGRKPSGRFYVLCNNYVTSVSLPTCVTYFIEGFSTTDKFLWRYCHHQFFTFTIHSAYSNGILNNFHKYLNWEWNRPMGETTIKKAHHAIYRKVVWKW